MAKSKKPSTQQANLQLIQSDVASFASSLGLSSSLPSSGFNDSDFRPHSKNKPPINPNSQKQKPISKNNDFAAKNNKIPPFSNKPRSNKAKQQKPTSQNAKFQKPTSQNPKFQKPMSQNPKFEAEKSSNDEFVMGNLSKLLEKYKGFSKLPLVKASALGAWHVDEGEVEEKVLGGGERKRVGIENDEKWKEIAEEKKRLAERLLVQYTVDYEQCRGESGDIKMLIATQRSGTAADKVSAFSVLIGDNPIANMRALDALLGNLILIGFG